MKVFYSINVSVHQSADIRDLLFFAAVSSADYVYFYVYFLLFYCTQIVNQATGISTLHSNSNKLYWQIRNLHHQSSTENYKH